MKQLGQDKVFENMKNFQISIKKLFNENKSEEANVIISEYEKFILSDMRIYFYKALILLKQNRTEEAENVLLEGINKSPLNYDYNYNYNLACVYEENKDYLKALDIYERLMTQVENINTKKYLMDKIDCLEKNYRDLIEKQLREDYSSNIKDCGIANNRKSINLHLMPDNFFCKRFMEHINKNYNKEEHIFFLLTPKENLEYVNPDDFENLKVIHLKVSWEKCMEVNTQEILEYIHKSDKIFIHYLTDFICWLICRHNINKKLFWILWGGDLYSSIDINLLDSHTYRFIKEKKITWNINKYKNSIQYIYKKGAIRNISYILTWNEGDYKLVKENFITAAKHNSFFYPNPVDFNLLDNVIEKNIVDKQLKSKFKNIFLVGNSGDPSNNHIEILNNLRKFTNEDFGVVVPLSYGNPVYVNEIITEGKRLLGDRFIPLTDFLQPEEYAKVLNSIDIAFMNHNRQQGVGNIWALLYLRKKVYMKNTITTYYTFNKLGVSLFDIDKVKYNDFSEIIEINKEIENRNREIIFNEYNLQKSKQYLNSILNNSCI